MKYIKFYFFIIFIIVSVSGKVYALEKDTAKTDPDNYITDNDNNLLKRSWTDGWYFLTGIGPSGGTYINNLSEVRSSGGFHLETVVGYYSHDAFGIEVGSFVSVQYFDDVPTTNSGKMEDVEIGDMIFWDTAFFWAIRVRWPNVTNTDAWNPYFRLLNGWGNGVGFICDTEDESGEYEYLEDVRIQLQGPIFGFSIGNVFCPQNKNPVWYVQFTVLLQIYWDGYIVKSSTELPVVLSRTKLSDNDHKLQAFLTFGTRLF